MSMPARLLVFNLATDTDHSILGFTSDWLRALAPHMAAIDVITMWAGRFELPANVRVHSVGKEQGRSEPSRAIEFYRILHRLLSIHRYEACFAHMQPLFCVMGAPLLHRHGIPITLWYTHGATSMMLRLAERLADRVVTAGSDTFKLPSRKLRVIGHAIDLDLFQPAPSNRESAGPFTVIAVGRVSPVKRIEAMIEAVAALAPTAPAAGLKLRLVGPIENGDREYASALQRRALALGIHELVEFAGPVRRSDLASEYASADVALNLTPSGALDKSALEAMACGVPLITSNPALGAEVASVDRRLVVGGAEPAVVAAALGYVHGMTAQERMALGVKLREKTHGHSLATLPERLLRVMPRRTVVGAAFRELPRTPRSCLEPFDRN
jgi:glycosyltransferase involved in cell wall biosynthesis